MPEKRDEIISFREMAARMRRLSDEHAAAENPLVAAKLQGFAAELEKKAAGLDAHLTAAPRGHGPCGSCGAGEPKKAMSYFRRMAAQSFRRARSSAQPHLDYETLLRLGRGFKTRATAARERLAAMRAAAARKHATE